VNLRRIMPPVYFYIAAGMMLSIHILRPGAGLFPFPWSLLGVLPLALGIGLVLLVDHSMKTHGTTVKPHLEPTALITSGRFRLSRHPMYLGFTLILVGFAVLLGSATPHLVLIAYAVFIDYVFVRYEEYKLQKTFSDAWLAYTRKVRRWI